MPSIRHKEAIRRIKVDAVKLTKREREKLGLSPGPVRRDREPVPFPSDPARYVWFALTTLPQREDAAAHALSRAGFAAFNPTELVTVRACRRIKFRRRERERAMFTSTVLAGFPGHRTVRTIPAHEVPDGKGGYRRIEEREVEFLAADVPWFDVLALEDVVKFIGMGGLPKPVPLGNVLAIRMRCGQRASTRNWSPALGAPVEVAFGAFQGKAGEVVELADGQAKVMLFGGKGVLARIVEPLTVPETWLREAEAV